MTTRLQTDLSQTDGAIRQLFVLNECTLVPVIARVLSGRRPVVLCVDARIRLLARLLDRIYNVLAKRKKIVGLEFFGDALPWLPRFPLEKNLTHGAIADIEGVVQDAVLQGISGPRADFYLYPMKKAVTEYSEKTKDLYLVFDWLEKFQGVENLNLRGFPGHFETIYRHKKGRPPGVTLRRFPLFDVFLNALNLVSLTIASLGWLAVRMRLQPGGKRIVRLAADRSSALDSYIFATVIDDPADLVIVDRSAERARVFGVENRNYEMRLVSDTRISLFDLFRLGAALFGDTAWLWRTTRKFDPALFGRFVTIAAKRAIYKAFFIRFRPRFYWGRDDYSLDHLVRNRELRAIGGVSLGVNHGLPLNTFVAAWREVDFDIYYSFGTHLYDAYYSKTWAPEVTIKPVGSLHMKRQYRARLNASRPRDIAFFPVVVGPFEQIFHEAFKVARHFPDRRMIVKMKAGRHDHYQQIYAKLMTEAPDNVEVFSGTDPYELLLSVSYGICFTTLVAEALQFRVKTFNLDMDPRLDRQYYRHFPGLTVTNGEEIISRIEAIESGGQTYDFGQYDSLIRIDGPDPFDVIRGDIGLPPTAALSSGHSGDKIKTETT